MRGLCRAWEWNCLQIHSGDHVHRHLISVCHAADAVADRRHNTEARKAHIWKVLFCSVVLCSVCYDSVVESCFIKSPNRLQWILCSYLMFLSSRQIHKTQRKVLYQRLKIEIGPRTAMLTAITAATTIKT